MSNEEPEEPENKTDKEDEDFDRFVVSVPGILNIFFFCVQYIFR